MEIPLKNKKKIINDPVYGLLSFKFEILFDIIEHPYFQRLRRIQQLGLTELVYPGARHTRFQHTIGAMYLVSKAIDVLRAKNHCISEAEELAVMIAILMHDIGHGPFSHTLEFAFVENMNHEEIGILFMQELNLFFDNKLQLAIEIYTDKYPKKFLHQLVSSQLDMDRLDYLRRDSFYTGVSEGIVGFDRIIKMLDVHNDILVIESKGIYSVENFLIARRLMYWQVYLHKTVVVAEQMLIKIIERVKYLIANGSQLFVTPALGYFLKNKIKRKIIIDNKNVFLKHFAQLDDNDIITSIKIWAEADDFVLSFLCKGLLNRDLLRIELYKDPAAIDSSTVNRYLSEVQQKYGINREDATFLVFCDSVQNKAYSPNNENIMIKYNSGFLVDIAQASDMSNVSALAKIVEKYYICFPKCFYYRK